MKTYFPLTRHGACLAMCLAVSTPVWALGLGEIESYSSLFGPLTAQIELNGASSADLRELSIRFGSEDEYLQIGEQRPAYLSVIDLSIGWDSRANPVIRLDSQSSVDAAVLGLLIRVITPRGQIQKFYNLLLDPPDWDVSDDGRQFITSPARRKSEFSTPEITVLEADVDDARQEQSIELDALIGAGLIRGDRYGPVRNGDRIYLIARRTHLDRSISINQIMLAYLRANPSAFKGGNLSGLRQGVILRIPSHAEAKQLSKEVAATRVSRHNSAWKSGDIQPPEETYVEQEIDAVPDHLTGTSALNVELSNQLEFTDMAGRDHW